MSKPASSRQNFASGILGTFFVGSVLNWFLFFGISMYLHGDALGTLPSKDGFVVKSHGHYTPVSESVWVFSLFYSGATVLVTPAIWLAAAAFTFSGEWGKGKPVTRFVVIASILLWGAGWYSSIGASFYRSVEDWRKFTPPPNQAMQPQTFGPDLVSRSAA